MELRFEGVCCGASLQKHKKGEVAGDISIVGYGQIPAAPPFFFAFINENPVELR
jgi:hypothetical protein